MALNNYSNVLMEEDNPSREEIRQGLAAATEAAFHYRQLEKHRPGAHLAGLAMALSNLACRLAGEDRLKEALAADEESVEIYTGLAARIPGYLPELCMAINNHSAHLSAADLVDEALC